MTDQPLMSCIEISRFGPPEVLTPARRRRPTPGPGEVLIRVAAAGVNRPDIVQRQGDYPPPPDASDLPGLEVSGTVVQLGPGVSAPAEGSQVCALLTGGGYAEYATAAAALCLPIPQGTSLLEAAALPEATFTVWHNVFERGRLQAGESVLIHGGSSGIGTTAIQMAKAFGAKAYATAGSDEKCRACERLGADLAINYRTEDYVSIVRATAQKGVDVVLDMVGGDYVARNLKTLRPEGRHVSIAFLQGSKITLDLMPVLLKRLTLIGSVLRSQSVDAKSRIASALLDKVWPLLDAGRLRPEIHATLPLTSAADAHRLMENSSHIGKILLLPNEEARQ